jgi:hypothetical protein
MSVDDDEDDEGIVELDYFKVVHCAGVRLRDDPSQEYDPASKVLKIWARARLIKK